MTEQRKGTARSALKQDALVERLAPDPAAPADVVVLSGFVGTSARPGYWRLYLTADLAQYVEIADADIVHHQPIADTQSTVGGTTLWVRRSATLAHTQTASREVQAQFLTGAIASGAAAGAGAARAAVRGKVHYDSVNLCPTDVGPCASDVRCPTASWRFCPTERCGSAFCQSDACGTHLGCDTFKWQLC